MVQTPVGKLGWIAIPQDLSAMTMSAIDAALGKDYYVTSITTAEGLAWEILHILNLSQNHLDGIAGMVFADPYAPPRLFAALAGSDELLKVTP